jgi:hypothetical protein
MTKGNPYSEAHNAAAKRVNLRKLMAWHWLQIHRPDVVDTILYEVEQIYPKVSVGRRAKYSLPKSLEKMK